MTTTTAGIRLSEGRCPVAGHDDPLYVLHLPGVQGDRHPWGWCGGCGIAFRLHGARVDLHRPDRPGGGWVNVHTDVLDQHPDGPAAGLRAVFDGAWWGHRNARAPARWLSTSDHSYPQED